MADKILEDILKNHEQYKIIENINVTTQDLLSNFYKEKKLLTQ